MIHYNDLLPSSSTPGSSEGLEHLTPVLRNILVSKQQDHYLRVLNNFVTAKESEIEQVCRAEYQVRLDFVLITSFVGFEN